MARTIVNSRKVAHLWAHQAQTHAQNGSDDRKSFYFERDTIYSYGSHFPIARHVRGGVLMTYQTYSVSTSRHCSFVRQAIPNNVTIVYVYDPTDDTKTTLKRFREDIRRAKGLLFLSRRGRSQTIKYAELGTIVRRANVFCEFSRIKTRFAMPEFDKLGVEKEQFDRQLERERKAQIAKEHKREREREAERLKAIEAERKVLETWRMGGNVRTYFRGTYLRIRPELNTIETSHGADFPIQHALRILPTIKRLIESGGTYKRNGHTIHLGPYPLDSIDETGTLRAGCHVVEKSEVLRLIADLESLAPDYVATLAEPVDATAEA